MNPASIAHQERELLRMEIRQFMSPPRILHFVPLAVTGVMMVLWPYFGSPFVPAFIVLFSGLETQINNILFRTPLELESLSIFPIEWQHVVKAKNVATILLLLVMFPIVAATLVYFAPTTPTYEQAGGAALYITTIIFPVMHIGNMRSVQHPRRNVGWQIDDLAGVVELLISMGILSIPYFLFAEVLRVPALCLGYFAATAIFWWRYSIPKTANLIEARRTDQCLTT